MAEVKSHTWRQPSREKIAISWDFHQTGQKSSTETSSKQQYTSQLQKYLRFTLIIK